jgi:hypothetical protein
MRIILLTLNLLFAGQVALAQVTIGFGPSSQTFEFDPGTGSALEVFEMPLLMNSTNSEPVVALNFEAQFLFEGFSSGVAAANSAVSVDPSVGAFASAEFFQIDVGHPTDFCLPSSSSNHPTHDLRMIIIDSLQGPFTGHVIAVDTLLALITLEVPSGFLVNDLNGADVLFYANALCFNDPHEVVYLNGTSSSVSIQQGTGFLLRRANSFRRGNFDTGGISLSDVVYSLLYMFGGGAAPPCLDSIDSNDDGVLDVSDPLYTLAYDFNGGPPPPPPFSQCGIDTTPDALDCAADMCF